jgi:CDP-4-dehydro-6-deoxyglucose reductase, E1
LIEDSCDALGSSHSGRMCGAWGDLSTLSFYPAHTITAGEGGMVLTDDPKLARIVLSLRDWGRGCWCKPGEDNACGHRFDNGYDHKHIHVRMGYNLKATDLQAAIGVAQMDRLPGFVVKRRENYQYLYWKLCYGKRGLTTLPGGAVPFGFPIILHPDTDRAKMCRYLEAHGVGVRMIFGGMPDQHPAYKHITYRVSGELPNTKAFYERGIWVGCWPGLNMVHLNHIVNTIQEYDTCKKETLNL